jgi:dTDP-glucose 4,6-dehydratase
MRLIVTGGSGFIGNNLIRLFLKEKLGFIANIDRLSYASTYSEIHDPNYEFFHTNILDYSVLKDIFLKIKPTHIIHAAACSHVDNSLNFEEMDDFVQTNVQGTLNLLKLSYPLKNKFLNVSSDEVYGSLDKESADEKYLLNPTNPYSATKAGAEHLVNTFNKTFGLNTVISRCTNNYGPFQNREKFIPNCINNLINGKPITLYGDGKQVREWIYVDDHCRALLNLLHNSESGQVYNIPGGQSMKNIDVAKMICKKMNLNPDEYISFVEDRLGHDVRYSIKSTKMEALGFQAEVDFNQGLDLTIDWYLKNLKKESLHT